MGNPLSLFISKMRIVIVGRQSHCCIGQGNCWKTSTYSSKDDQNFNKISKLFTCFEFGSNWRIKKIQNIITQYLLIYHSLLWLCVTDQKNPLYPIELVIIQNFLIMYWLLMDWSIFNHWNETMFWEKALLKTNTINFDYCMCIMLQQTETHLKRLHSRIYVWHLIIKESLKKKCSSQKKTWKTNCSLLKAHFILLVFIENTLNL